MIYDRMLLGRKAKELRFNRDTYEKVCRLVDVLSFFENDTLLSKALMLKGGTALNLTVFDVPRLSVDIDLDYTENVSREEMLNSRGMITDRISKYMEANGYNLSKKSKKYHALDSFVYEYINAGGMKDNLKIEINYMNRCHILPCSRRQVAEGFSDNPVSVLCADPIELYASKIVALINRSTPRDLFDVYNLSEYIKLTPEESNLLRKCIVFYIAISSSEISGEPDWSGIDSITQQSIKMELLPVLREKYFDAETAKAACKSFLQDLLKYSKEEKEFLSEFARRNYKPELIFGNSAEAERIKSHPMALFKCSKMEKESVLGRLSRAKENVEQVNGNRKNKTKKQTIE